MIADNLLDIGIAGHTFRFGQGGLDDRNSAPDMEPGTCEKMRFPANFRSALFRERDLYAASIADRRSFDIFLSGDVSFRSRELDIARHWSTAGGSGGMVPKSSRNHRPSACTISSVIFFASPNSIIVFGRKNSSLSTPEYPDAIDRFTNNTVFAFSTSRTGIP